MHLEENFEIGNFLVMLVINEYYTTKLCSTDINRIIFYTHNYILKINSTYAEYSEFVLSITYFVFLISHSTVNNHPTSNHLSKHPGAPTKYCMC